MIAPQPRAWRAEPDDAETVGRLLVAFRDDQGREWPSENAMLAIVERLIEQPDVDFLLASPDDDSPPAGVCQLRYRLSAWTATYDCELEDLYVDEPARRSGCGAALVAAAVERARERRCRRIQLDANELNAPALALYERFGFSERTPDVEGRNLLLRLRLA